MLATVCRLVTDIVKQVEKETALAARLQEEKNTGIPK